MTIDGILMAGFGGPTPGCCGRRPTCPRTPGCEAECFVSKVVGDRPGMEARIAEVAAHYTELGGFSPYNQRTAAQRDALIAALHHADINVPVHMGFRHWPPWFDDALVQLRDAGATRVGLLILTAQQSSVSWQAYIDEAHVAAERVGGIAIGHVLAPFGESTAYAQACANRIIQATADWPKQRFDDAALVFSAHAIPQPAEARSPYRQQFETAARQAAAILGHPDHHIAFQSAPDRSRVPWSSPKIDEVLPTLAEAGYRDVILQPAGFLVDHVEVRYDLDHEAAAQAEALGLILTRAATVEDEATFIDLLAERIRHALQAVSGDQP